jgi:hypothetical protein
VKRGRPTLVTEELKAQLVMYRGLGFNVEECAERLGVGTSVVRKASRDIEESLQVVEPLPLFNHLTARLRRGYLL